MLTALRQYQRRAAGEGSRSEIGEVAEDAVAPLGVADCDREQTLGKAGREERRHQCSRMASRPLVIRRNATCVARSAATPPGVSAK